MAVAHELSNVQSVIEEVKNAINEGKELPYHFIEVMACRGGCVGGGGQPYGATDEIRKKRSEGLYKDDVKSEYRSSHQNPYIKQLYDEFLEEPLSHTAHKYLHTNYKSRPLYNK